MAWYDAQIGSIEKRLSKIWGITSFRFTFGWNDLDPQNQSLEFSLRRLWFEDATPILSVKCEIHWTNKCRWRRSKSPRAQRSFQMMWWHKNHRRSCEICCDFQECLRSSSFVLQILLDHRLRILEHLRCWKHAEIGRDFDRLEIHPNACRFNSVFSWPLKSRFRNLQTFHVGCSSNQTVIQKYTTWLDMFQRIPMGIRWVNGFVIEPWRAASTKVWPCVLLTCNGFGKSQLAGLRWDVGHWHGIYTPKIWKKCPGKKWVFPKMVVPPNHPF